MRSVASAFHRSSDSRMRVRFGSKVSSRWEEGAVLDQEAYGEGGWAPKLLPIPTAFYNRGQFKTAQLLGYQNRYFTQLNDHASLIRRNRYLSNLNIKYSITYLHVHIRTNIRYSLIYMEENITCLLVTGSGIWHRRWCLIEWLWVIPAYLVRITVCLQGLHEIHLSDWLLLAWGSGDMRVDIGHPARTTANSFPHI